MLEFPKAGRSGNCSVFPPQPHSLMNVSLTSPLRFDEIYPTRFVHSFEILATHPSMGYCIIDLDGEFPGVVIFIILPVMLYELALTRNQVLVGIVCRDSVTSDGKLDGSHHDTSCQTLSQISFSLQLYQTRPAFAERLLC